MLEKIPENIVDRQKKNMDHWRCQPRVLAQGTNFQAQIILFQKMMTSSKLDGLSYPVIMVAPLEDLKDQLGIDCNGKKIYVIAKS